MRSVANRFRTALVVLLCGLVFPAVAGCSNEPVLYNYARVFLNDQGVLAVSKQDAEPTRIAVYFHGLDSDEKVLLDDAHRGLVDTLVNNGYAVVASNAGGNVFGNAGSQSDYVELIRFAQEHYGGPLPVYFIAESMGAIAASNIYAEVPELDVLGMVGISPALDFENTREDFRPAIAAAYAPDSPDRMDPLNLAPEALAGKHFRFWASDSDTVVPAALNAQAFANKFGSVTDVTVTPCTGEHSDPSCMPAGQILEWLDQL
ncbi:MAG: alpha/beta hydrolase [Mycobacterium sp.]